MAATFRSKKYRQKCVNIVGTLGDAPDLIIFDLETTGLSPKTARIIEFAGIRYRANNKNGLLTEVDYLHLYINPGFLVEPKIEELTGITNEFLQDKPYEEDVFPQIAAFLAQAKNLVLSGYNIDNFDIKFMRELYARHGVAWPCADDRTIDVIEMARDVFPPSEVANYKLGTIADACDFSDGVQFHSAIEDTKVTAKVFQVCFLNYLADMQEENHSQTPSLTRPQVLSVNFWEGYRGMSRVYVNLSSGRVYYDIVKKSWLPADESTDIASLDMEYIEDECLRQANASSLAEFARNEAARKTQHTDKAVHKPPVPRTSLGGNVQPIIQSITFWAGVNGWSRIYVNTDHGSLYLNVRRLQWETKDANLNELDIQYIEQKCYELTGTSSLAEFATFTGRINITR